MFLKKLVRVMPTLSDKRRAVEISPEIQQNIANYLLTVSLINLGPVSSQAPGSTYSACPMPR